MKQAYSHVQREAGAQLYAKEAKLEKANTELASSLTSTAEENGNLKLSLQQEREAAAESKVQPRALKIFSHRENLFGC